MKIRSLEELENALDTDFAWRKKEISTIKLLVSSARKHEKEVLIRSGIALMYAHWEGHIKTAAEIYLRYLNSKAPKYKSMRDNFVHLSLGERFSQGFSIKKYKSQKEIFDYLDQGLDRAFSVDEKKIVDTESNLKSEVFVNLLMQLGFDLGPFELKVNFIDKVMVKNRNSVAHGDRLDSTELEEAYMELQSDLMSMIETFQNMVRNAASNRAYLKEAV